MPTIGERLTTKIGPLPVVAWAGMAAGAYVIYAYATRSKSESSDSAPQIGYGDVGDSDDFSDGYGNATGSYTVDNGTVTSTYPGAGEMDVGTWAQRSLGYLISQGYSVADANRAIWVYLNGESDALTGVQFHAWEAAVKAFGLPPGGEALAPPPKETTTPPPTNPPPTNPPPATPKQKTQYRAIATFEVQKQSDKQERWIPTTKTTSWYDTQAAATNSAKSMYNTAANTPYQTARGLKITYETRKVNA